MMASSSVTGTSVPLVSAPTGSYKSSQTVNVSKTALASELLKKGTSWHISWTGPL